MTFSIWVRERESRQKAGIVRPVRPKASRPFLLGPSASYGTPPRSLYTTLPRQFLFEETTEVPTFLRQAKDRHVRRILRENPKFHRLTL